MDQDTYKLITRVCKGILISDLHSRHLEDMIQEVAMNFWKNGMSGNIKWMALNYLRINGFGKSGKVGAKAIENSVFVGINGASDDDCGSCLIDKFQTSVTLEEKIEEVIFIPKRLIPKEIVLKEISVLNFLESLKLKQETLKWVTDNLSLNQQIRFVM